MSIDFGDPCNANTNNPHVYNTIGNYTVTVDGYDNLTFCYSYKYIPVTILSSGNPPPLSLTPSQTICSGSQAILNVYGATTYTWSNGAHTSSITVNPITSTTYSVYGATACGTSSAQTTVYIANPSTVTVSQSSICAGNSATLTASGASSYTWNPGSLTGATVIVSPTVTTSYTVSNINACGTSSAVSTVTVNPLPIVTVSSKTICAGNSALLSASGASSYVWNPGNVSNSYIVVTPSITTVYTVTGTNTCGSSSNTTNVTVNPKPTVTTSNYTICAGNAATLTASGANTYTWNPGNLVGASITVSPSANTSYTITGSNTSACTNTAVANIYVVNNNVPPTFSIITPSLNVVANGTGTNVINLSTNITNTVGLSFYWYANGATTPATNFNLTQPEIIKLAVSNAVCGSSSTQSICVNYVAQSCANTYSTLNNYTVTNIAQIPNGTYYVTGTLVFDWFNQPYGISNKTFILSTGSKVLITKKSDIIFLNTNFFSCSGMWQGIELQATSTEAPSLRFNSDGSKIEDAYMGIYSINSSGINRNPKIYLTDNVTFNKNYYDVYIENTFDVSSTYPLIINSVRFLSENSNTSPGNNLKCSGFYSPNIKSRSYSAIYMQNAGAVNIYRTFGSLIKTLIKNKDYGMYFKSTNAHVYDVEFNDLRGLLPITCQGCTPYSPVGIGIYSENSGGLNVYPPDGGSAVNTLFTNVGYGVITSNVNKVDMQYCAFSNPNQFNNISTGYNYGKIGIKTVDANILTRINHNTFDNVSSAVINTYSIAATDAGFVYSVSENTLTAITGTLSNGIDVSSSVPFNGTITSQVVAANSMSNVSTAGIRTQNVTGGLRISGNTINMKNLTTGTRYGILLDGANSNVKVDANTINGNLTGSANAFNVNCTGIRVVSSAGCKIQCNTVTNVGKGIEFNGVNTSPNEGFINNTLAFPIRRGLVLSNGGLIGTQGSSTRASANQWVNWPTTFDALDPNQTLVGGPNPASISSNAANSPLWVRNTSAEFPVDNSFITPATQFDKYSFSGTTLNPSVPNYSACIQPLSQGARFINGAPTNKSNADRDADFVRYINTLLPATSNSLSPQDKFMLKQYMYDALNQSPSSNRTMVTFYNQQQNAAIDQYYDIDNLLAQGNINMASNKNSQASVTNDITQTQNEFNGLYINWYNNNSNYTDLYRIANLCPNQFGRSVYQARAMIKAIDYNEYSYNDSCYTDKLNARFGFDDENEKGISVNNGVMAKIFPNPNNGSFMLAYDLKNKAEALVLITDISGKVVFNQSIDNLNSILNINTMHLQSGIYFIQLSNDGNLLWIDKLLITK